MKFPALVLSSICGFAGVALASPAFAHIQLTAPTPRVPNKDNLKSTPCGDYVRNPARVNMAKPGDTITVEWDETIPHPGYFRVKFDEDGQDGLAKPTEASFKIYSDYYNGERNNTTVDKLPKLVMGPVKDGGGWVLLDNYGLHPSGPKKKYSVKVTLPNVTCDKCTLQVVQGMYESSRTYDNAYYYHCADFILKGDVAADAGTAPSPDAGVAMGGSGGGQAGQSAGGQGGKASGGSAGSAGQGGNNNQGGEGGENASGGKGGGGGDAETSEKSDGGGCSFGGRNANAFAVLMLVFVAVASLFRRRRMPR